MFLHVDEGMIEVKPGLELVSNIVVSLYRGDFFFAMFQVKIIIDLSTFAKSVDEVG